MNYLKKIIKKLKLLLPVRQFTWKNYNMPFPFNFPMNDLIAMTPNFKTFSLEMTSIAKKPADQL